MVSEILPEQELNIQSFILDKRTLPACPAEFLQLNINNNEQTISTTSQLQCGVFPFARTKVFSAPLKAARILVPGGDENSSKRVLEVTYDVSSCKDFDFLPGDTVGILTTNEDSEVDEVLHATRLSASSDEQCEVSIRADNKKKTAKIPVYIPTQSTPRSIIRDCLNIRSVPKKLFIRALAEYTTEKEEREFLETLSSKEGAAFYSELTSQRRFDFLQLLRACPSCRPPLSLLIEHLPRLLPRPYSIANSPLTCPTEINVIFSVLDKNAGLATSMLEKLVKSFPTNSDQVPHSDLYLREPNAFRYSKDDFSKNQILISIGCGVSPFLGFLDHKYELSKECSEQIGESWLFTGYRCSSNSLYRAELQKHQSTGILNRLFESFSREQDSQFKYVQDQIRENASEFIEFLSNENTVLFVCADGAEISKDIEKCLKECLQSVSGVDEDEASKIVSEYKKSGKYREDIWN